MAATDTSTVKIFVDNADWFWNHPCFNKKGCERSFSYGDPEDAAQIIIISQLQLK
jgi:hypothetical protein